jgi:hypothetical protein
MYDIYSPSIKPNPCYGEGCPQPSQNDLISHLMETYFGDEEIPSKQHFIPTTLPAVIRISLI